MNTDNSSSFVDKPIFLVGAERSGTTVLRLMLDHHPQIAWCYEFEYAVDQMLDNGDFPKLEAYNDTDTARLKAKAKLKFLSKEITFDKK